MMEELFKDLKTIFKTNKIINLTDKYNGFIT